MFDYVGIVFKITVAIFVVGLLICLIIWAAGLVFGVMTFSICGISELWRQRRNNAKPPVIFNGWFILVFYLTVPLLVIMLSHVPSVALAIAASQVPTVAYIIIRLRAKRRYLRIQSDSGGHTTAQLV